MSKLEKSVSEAINKNLPSQVGEALQERLKEADAMEKELSDLKEIHDSDFKSLRDKRSECERLSKKLDMYREKSDCVNKKEEELIEREIKLRINESRRILIEEHAKEKCKLMREIFEIPFKNRIIRETTQTQVPIVRERTVLGEYNSQTCCSDTITLRDDIVEDSTNVIEKEEL